MQTLTLQQAISEIVQTVRSRQQSPGRAPDPFFLIVGSGISSPPLPTASEMEAGFRQKLESEGVPLPELPAQPAARYARLFEAAYPQAEDRRHFLEGLLRGKALSAANLRLAHFLGGRDSDGRPHLTHLVVTPNFDDQLSRALRLFGYDAEVIDNPAAVDFLDRERTRDVQIVHVHGTYRHYDCRNLLPEIRANARSRGGMRRLLGQLLDSHRSPVVLGYSGWEGDVIMSALSEHLRRRRKAGLPNKIYWFCHRRDSLEALPAWLRSDRNLAFVLPEEPRLSGDSGNALARDLEEPEATLPAHRVIGALIHAFGVAPPLLASDPLGFLADQLRLALDLACSEAEPALYNLERVLQRVEHGRSLEAEHWTLTERRLQDFWDAVQRGDDEASVVAGENLIALRLDGAERGKIVDQLDIVRRGLSSHRSTLGLRACDVSLALTPRGVERAPYEGWALRKALALVGRGYRLGQLDRTEEALASYAEVFSSFGDAPAGELREQVIWALYNHSVRLGQLDRAERVLALHAAELENFESSPVSVLREQIIWAIYSHGARLCQIGRLQEAVASCAEVLERSADASVPALREVAGRALLLRGEALGKLDRPEEALISFAEVAERFAGDSTLPLREVVSQALVNQGVTLGLLGREEEALAIFAKVLSRFDDDQAPELRSSVARALANRGVVLLNLDRHEEAAMSFAMVLRRFGDESAPEILRTVEMARRALGSGVPSDGH